MLFFRRFSAGWGVLSLFFLSVPADFSVSYCLVFFTLGLSIALNTIFQRYGVQGAIIRIDNSPLLWRR